MASKGLDTPIQRLIFNPSPQLAMASINLMFYIFLVTDIIKCVDFLSV